MNALDNVEAYPLAWPAGWPRTPEAKRDAGRQFGQMNYVSTQGGGGYKSRGRITPDVARKGLQEELRRLGARSAVISSNVKLRNDGEMRADDADRRHSDPGIAVYFTLKGKQMVMAQDSFDNVASNLRSLSLAIEALRALDRHGGGTMMERAFAGFSALPPPEGHKPKRPWWDVLRYSANPEDRELLSADEVEARFRTLAKKAHPDVEGGSTEAMAELNQAREDALADIQKED